MPTMQFRALLTAKPSVHTHRNAPATCTWRSFVTYFRNAALHAADCRQEQCLCKGLVDSSFQDNVPAPFVPFPRHYAFFHAMPRTRISATYPAFPKRLPLPHRATRLSGARPLRDLANPHGGCDRCTAASLGGGRVRDAVVSRARCDCSSILLDLAHLALEGVLEVNLPGNLRVPQGVDVTEDYCR